MLLDLVLPTGCAGCDAVTAPWCASCRGRIGPGAIVRAAGLPVLTVGRYRGPLRTALLRYKERNRRDLGAALGGLLAERLDALPRGPDGLWLVPAPSRPAAARPRGGDHVARLCRSLAAGRPGVHVARPLLLARGARDSVGLDAAQRAANLAGSVRLRALGSAAPPAGATVVLVDDVITTGATLRACQDVLAAAGTPTRAGLVLCDATSHR